MKKRRTFSKEAIERIQWERNERRAHTLECNETRSKGFVADDATLLALVERQYRDGDISKRELELAIMLLKGDPDEEEQEAEMKGWEKSNVNSLGRLVRYVR